MSERGERLVRVRLRSGDLDLVTVVRAARLLRAGEAEPVGWSADDSREVLRTLEQRQRDEVARLARDGNLMHADLAVRPPSPGSLAERVGGIFGRR